MMHSQQIAFIFPGQGESHSVGMAKDFYDEYQIVRDTFEEASKITGLNLQELIFEGPLEKLSETRYCQIAIYVVSIAILRVIQQEFPHLQPVFTGGLSLGEYTAATACGALSFEQGVKLVFARGSLMQEACNQNPSTMAVVLGFDEAQVQAVLDTINLPEELWMANLNCPGQIVVTGTHKGIERFIEEGKKAGAKRVLPLNVAGAFHSPLMQSAAIQLEEILNQMNVVEPKLPIAMNATGTLETELSSLKKNLISQITSPVRWQACIEEMQSKGVQCYLEIGPGKVLSGLNKRIKVTGQTHSINSVQDLELLKSLITC